MRLSDGYLELGPAVKPNSAMRFYRGRAPQTQGVPLYRGAAGVHNAQSSAQEGSR